MRIQSVSSTPSWTAWTCVHWASNTLWSGTQGAPPNHPGVLLKLYLYGYLNHSRSSRRLEKEANRNVELMWLLRKLAPDFKTIADFRRNNGRAIREVCRQFKLLCRQWGMFAIALVVNREWLDLLWNWVRALPSVVEIIVWVLFLPITVGLWIWESSWPALVRLSGFAGIVVWTLLAVYSFFRDVL
jgi:hypothetical protein